MNLKTPSALFVVSKAQHELVSCLKCELCTYTSTRGSSEETNFLEAN